MAHEDAVFISGLTPTTPKFNDFVAQGDDQLRLIKQVLQNTFPNADKSFRFPTVLQVTEDYGVVVEDENKLILGVTSTVDIIVTLPALAPSNAGWQIRIGRLGNVELAVVIRPTQGLIMGEAEIVVRHPAASIHLEWTGETWVGTSLAIAEAIAAADEAEASAAAAAASATAALASEEKAEQWADNEEELPVEQAPDRFSAKHYAAKAEGFAGDAAASATSAEDSAITAAAIVGVVPDVFWSTRYNIVGDNSNDDTPGFVDAMTELGGLGVPQTLNLSPGKRFVITGPIIIPSQVLIEGNRGILKPSGAVGFFALQPKGSGLSTATTVTAAAKRGEFTISLASAANAAVGRLMNIRRVIAGAFDVSMMTIVRGVSGSTVTLLDALEFDINPATDEATEVRFISSPAEHCGVRRLIIDCVDWTGGTEARPIRHEMVKDLILEDITIRNAAGLSFAWSGQYCYGGKIEILGEHIGGPSSNTGFQTSDLNRCVLSLDARYVNNFGITLDRGAKIYAPLLRVGMTDTGRLVKLQGTMGSALGYVDLSHGSASGLSIAEAASFNTVAQLFVNGFNYNLIGGEQALSFGNHCTYNRVLDALFSTGRNAAQASGKDVEFFPNSHHNYVRGQAVGRRLEVTHQAGVDVATNVVEDTGVFAPPSNFLHKTTGRYLSGMDSPPGRDRILLIDDLMRGLVSDGVYADLKVLSLLATHNEQAGKINAVDPAYGALSFLTANSGSPVHTVDRGLVGDTTKGTYATVGGFLLGEFDFHNLCLGAWIVAHPTATTAAGLATSVGLVETAGGNLFIRPFTAANEWRARLGGGSTAVFAPTLGTHLGLRTVERRNDDNLYPYLNGAAGTQQANTFSLVTGNTIALLRNGTDFYPGTMGVFIVANPLQDTKQTALHSRLNTYLAAIGAV